MEIFMKRWFLIAVVSALPSSATAEIYAKIDAYIVDKYRERGETSATAECLARSMVFAIPTTDRAELLKAVNGQSDASELIEKWLPIGNEKLRPEVGETMYGFCPLEFVDYVNKGTLR